MTETRVDPIRGRTIRWTWSEGPVAGVTHEHDFHEDGTVEWRVLDGPQKGHSAREEDYVAVPVAEDVYAVSYLGASGYMLTVVLNFENRQMVGFASGAGEWHQMKGHFAPVDTSPDSPS